MQPSDAKPNWDKQSVNALFELPFFTLIDQARAVHKANFSADEMEYCTLSSIKTGACPEDCKYCPQSGHYKTGLKKENLIPLETVLEQAQAALDSGAKRFCMGAAWKHPSAKDFPKVKKMVEEVKKLGLETCVTLGTLSSEQAEELKASGLDYYNHNVDTSPEKYSSIITTRTFEDRIDTIGNVVDAGINVCCGGIMGMGETVDDRVSMLLALLKLPQAPKSIPINQLIRIPGTPLQDCDDIEPFDFIKMIAVTRILFPQSMVRLSAGREEMTDEMQAWCFMAGANSIFLGDKLLTAKNPGTSHDAELMQKLGYKPPGKTAPTEQTQSVCC